MILSVLLCIDKHFFSVVKYYLTTDINQLIWTCKNSLQVAKISGLS